MKKTAWNTFAKEGKITAETDGTVDDYGKALWFDSEGKAYELRYARLARIYAFIRYPYYDKNK